MTGVQTCALPILVGNQYTTSQITANALQANNTVNTATLSVTGPTYTDKLQANTLVNTSALSVSGNTYANYIAANNYLSVPTALITTKLDANSAPYSYFANVVASSVQVNGNFVVAGQTIYSSNTFNLATGVLSNQNGFLNVYRPSGANAALRWYESGGVWQTLDVNNSTYYRVLTDEYLSGLSNSQNPLDVATSWAVANANTWLQSNIASTLAASKTYTNTANTYLQNLINPFSNFSQAAYNQANATNSYATSGYAQANAATNSATSAYLNANAAFIQANAAYNQANITNSYGSSEIGRAHV